METYKHNRWIHPGKNFKATAFFLLINSKLGYIWKHRFRYFFSHYYMFARPLRITIGVWGRGISVGCGRYVYVCLWITRVKHLFPRGFFIHHAYLEIWFRFFKTLFRTGSQALHTRFILQTIHYPPEPNHNYVVVLIKRVTNHDQYYTELLQKNHSFQKYYTYKED